MHITFSPARADAPLTVQRDGDALVLNGTRFDFAQLPEGAELPLSAIGSEHFSGSVRREAGQLQVALRLPHGPNPPKETLFPAPITVTENGAVPLPPYDVTDKETQA